MAYTFKDDGAALTYYREYNKEVGTGDLTLTGNWVEERALRETSWHAGKQHALRLMMDQLDKSGRLT